MTLLPFIDKMNMMKGFEKVQEQEGGMEWNTLERHRDFLKDSIRKTIDFYTTDQNSGVPPPPLQKPYRETQEMIPLIPASDFATLQPLSVQDAIKHRKSYRTYKRDPLTLYEVSFLLWASQGIRKVIDYGHAMRMVPSAGARHAIETYLAVLNISGLNPGIYRYLPLNHSLVVESLDDKTGSKIKEASFRQDWMARAAVIFIWTAVPYRMEWRYGLSAHRVILLDAGHVCQNLYLASEVVNAGVCAVAAYDQDNMDRLLGINGIDEFTIYSAAVGRLHP